VSSLQLIDEAHRIKGRTNSTSKAVYSLRSDFKWCLSGTNIINTHFFLLLQTFFTFFFISSSGTPLQNRVGELYSLVRFLRMVPQAAYLCSVADCSCMSFHWRFGQQAKFCVDCGHKPMSHYSWFNTWIANPITKYGYVGDGRRGLTLLQHGVLDLCMLRRTKAEKVEQLQLPFLTTSVELVPMSAAEEDFYQSIYTNSKVSFDSFVASGTMLHNYAHIFTLLSRLRQAACHPYLVRPSSIMHA
jgi:DNA repair protein RAD16